MNQQLPLQVMHQRVSTMMELQNRMNALVDGNWLNQRRDWMLAVMVESVEAIDHLDWKWWKGVTPDLAQVRLELVDIFHFALSKYIQTFRGNLAAAADAITYEFVRADKTLPVSLDDDEYVIASLSLVETLRLIAGLAAVRRWSTPLFEHAMNLAGMSFQNLYAFYIGKNALNSFRQANGYKQGTYRKDWNGFEDNEVLTAILNELTLADRLTMESITDALGQHYAALSPLGGQATEPLRMQ